MLFSFDFTLDDFYHVDGLTRLHNLFQRFIEETDTDAFVAYQNALSFPSALSKEEESALLITVAPFLEEFIGHLFDIFPTLTQLKQRHHKLSVIPMMRRNFIQRIAFKKYSHLSIEDFREASPFSSQDDLSCALELSKWMNAPDEYEEILDRAARYCVVETLKREKYHTHNSSVLFVRPQKINYEHLLQHVIKKDSCYASTYLQDRKGFDLTDSGKGQAFAIAESHYCIHCHHQGKDSCAKGLFEKQQDIFAKNQLGNELSGCPLDQKISEMNELKSKGIPLGALAVAMIDNPLLAATGNRICNDCVKACIFQKQTPVDIPSIETQILNDILDLPWGVEIYSLLSRWNPLNFNRPLPKNETSKCILVVGMGPAGFTLSHHLLNEGHTVVGIDGLKIEPWDIPFKPIKSWKLFKSELSSRTPSGFGGVIEYGITARYDKNYLTLIRLLLERRSHFLMKGGVRFGGTLSTDLVLESGFHHIALCTGAGSPITPNIENIHSYGVRYASDFLMTLQLSGAHREESIANLQIRLPIAIIGGGLTAIDTATEVMAYYPIQVKKFKKQYLKLVKELGKEAVEKSWSEYDQEVAMEFLEHANIFEKIDRNETGALQKKIQELGGVHILYRSAIHQSPSYRLNHEEIGHALAQGIYFHDNIKIQKIMIDDNEHVTGIDIITNILPTKTVLIAAGTKANINLNLDEECPTENEMFIAADRHGNIVSGNKHIKLDETYTQLYRPGYENKLSFFGDLHPTFKGNVVKAMASAKKGYPIISEIVNSYTKDCQIDNKTFLNKMDHDLQPVIESIEYISHACVQIMIKAPMAAKAFRPGHLYKLQNFEKNAPVQNGMILAMEGIALNGIEADYERGLLTFIIYEAGASSMMCRNLKVGEKVYLMGPTGTSSPVFYNKTILLIATHLHSAVLWSLAKKMKENNCKVIFVVTFKSPNDRFRPHKIEENADHVVWCYWDAQTGDASTELVCQHRENDFIFYGNIIDALMSLKESLDLTSIDHVILHGSNQLNIQIEEALKNQWTNLFQNLASIKGSVNAPMQCMMKGICSQCIQIHKDELGHTHMYYSCAESLQNIKTANYSFLKNRMAMNSLLEKISKLRVKNILM